MFDKEMMRILGIGLSISTEIVGFSGAGMLIGYGLRRLMGWENQLPLIVLGVVGLALGLYRAFKAYTRMDSKDGH